ncbi:MAG: hypothetical protein WCK00_12130, partial [Deltaproteobacteria bacterium]
IHAADPPHALLLHSCSRSASCTSAAFMQQIRVARICYIDGETGVLPYIIESVRAVPRHLAR